MARQFLSVKEAEDSGAGDYTAGPPAAVAAAPAAAADSSAPGASSNKLEGMGPIATVAVAAATAAAAAAGFFLLSRLRKGRHVLASRGGPTAAKSHPASATVVDQQTSPESSASLATPHSSAKTAATYPSVNGSGSSHVRHRRQVYRVPSSVVPLVEYFPGGSGSRPKRIERFGEYVVRQLGIPHDLAAASLLAQAADDYVKGDKSKADKSRQNLLALAVSACTGAPVELPLPSPQQLQQQGTQEQLTQQHAQQEDEGSGRDDSSTSGSSSGSADTYSRSSSNTSSSGSSGSGKGSNGSSGGYAGGSSDSGRMTSDERVNTLAEELIEELDTCMLAYFAFHWKHSGMLIEQVLRGGHHKLKLKDVVLSVTREQRFQRILNELKPQQKMNLLVEELKLLRKPPVKNASTPGVPPSYARVPASPSPLPADSGPVLVPADPQSRPPVLLLIGGGMGAGKSTVVREIMKRCFWARSAQDAVVVEADAFKEKDVVFRALSNDSLADMAKASQLVHEESTRAASSALVTALNAGRDVIFDGTMSWEPFVEQTIAMARDVHRTRYRLGPGYQEREDGSVEERYWEPVGPQGLDACCEGVSEEDFEEGGEEEEGGGRGSSEDGEGEVGSNADGVREGREDAEVKMCVPGLHSGTRKKNKKERRAPVSGPVVRRPYRIELVGVLCDAHLAVVRGIRRAILTKRAVPVPAQLKSHRMFASAVEKYCALVDHATIYNTNAIGKPPKLIAYKEEGGSLLIDPGSFTVVGEIQKVNADAKDVTELYFLGCEQGRLSSPQQYNEQQQGERQPQQQQQQQQQQQHQLLPLAWLQQLLGGGHGLEAKGMEVEEEMEVLGPGCTWHVVVDARGRADRQKRLRDAFTALQACLWKQAEPHSGLTSSTSFMADQKHHG